MKVEELSLSAIKPYAKNPRKNDGAVKGVAESIKQFGFQQPIVIDAKGVIVENRQALTCSFVNSRREHALRVKTSTDSQRKTFF